MTSLKSVIKEVNTEHVPTHQENHKPLSLSSGYIHSEDVAGKVGSLPSSEHVKLSPVPFDRYKGPGSIAVSREKILLDTSVLKADLTKDQSIAGK